MLFNDGLLLSEKSQKGLKVQRWLGHDEYQLKESPTQSNSIEVFYAGGATDAWQVRSYYNHRIFPSSDAFVVSILFRATLRSGYSLGLPER